jgi:hypothetical protein
LFHPKSRPFDPFPFRRRYHFVTRHLEAAGRTRRLYTFQARANGRPWARDASESVLNERALGVEEARDTRASGG